MKVIKENKIEQSQDQFGNIVIVEEKKIEKQDDKVEGEENKKKIQQKGNKS